MSDMKQTLSPRWLGGSEEQKSTGKIGSKSLDEAVIVYSRLILDCLDGAENKEMRIHDLIQALEEKINVPSFEEFLGVINQLVRLKFLEIKEEDKFGNHLVRLLRIP